MRIVTLKLKYFVLLAFPMLMFSQQHWIKLIQVDTVKIHRVVFCDSLTGWIAGDSGLIMKTTNSGLSWIRQNSNINQNIVELFMLDKNYGWGLSHFISNGNYFTKILKTTNGGENWVSTVYPEPDKLFLSVFFFDSLYGWMCGDFGTVVSTQDGGVSWSDVRVEPSEYPRLTVHKVKFFSPSFGIAVGGVRDLAAVVWRTTNGGDVWYVSLQGTEPLYDIHFKNSSEIIAFGGDFEFGASVVRSSDAGLNWDYQFIGIWGEGRSVAFKNPDTGFVALGYSGTYMYTTDGGYNWTDVYTPDSIRVYSVSFPNPNYGFMVGDEGTILKYAEYFKIEVTNNWNLLSIPVNTNSFSRDQLFPNSNSQAYQYLPGVGYRVQDSIKNGYGYWIKFPIDTVLNIFGARRPVDSINVKKGWNIIGSISNPVAVSNISTSPDGIINSNFFYYENGYKMADTLKPFLGYWVKVKEDGFIILK
ncbi:MAG: hypothetical protein IGBAC_0811 [Ignavibacteriae bacterium]|nr:MAG: hypothetical protein IGBAC_0811 [Ignavibacteriota bacterium]